MKSLILSCIAIIIIFSASAQISLDHKYDYSTTIVKFETLGYKYYLMDVPNAQCRIYNQDHSLYKTINCSVPSGYYLADIKFLSEKLFDTDGGIELAYTYYKYNSSQQYYTYGSKVINEDGSALITISGAQYLYINKTADDSYKLFAYCFDYSVFPETVWTNIYNISGTPTSIVENSSPEIELNMFPNPATQTVKVEYQLPGDVSTGILHLIDNSGRQLKQYTIDKHTNFLALDVSSFKSGTYHYFIEYGNTRSVSKKLVVR